MLRSLKQHGRRRLHRYVLSVDALNLADHVAWMRARALDRELGVGGSAILRKKIGRLYIQKI